MGKKRSKVYHQISKFNPIIQASKIEKLRIRIDNHQKDIASLTKSHDNHIKFLGNFARHDLKNAIQSMDSILSTTEPNQFDKDKIISMQEYLSVIRTTMDNFAKLVPHSINGKFTIDTLLVAVELLTRYEMHKHEVMIKFDFPRNSTQEIELPFQSLFQMINNLLLNSIKSLEYCKEKKIEVIGVVDETNLIIKIIDNGIEIPDENKMKIFDYGFSTTGGSGIGLHHAKYLCDQFKGNISVELIPEREFNKIFTITLPLIKNGEEHNNT